MIIKLYELLYHIKINFIVVVTQNKKNSNKILFHNDKIMSGIHIAKNTAEKHLKESKQHHENAEYQSAIPSSVFSFEESSKFDHLLDYLKKGSDVTRANWKELSEHKFKLTAMEKEIKNNVEKSSDLDQYRNSTYLRDEGLTLVPTSKDENILALQIAIEVQSKLSKLKEICLYTNWNEHKKDWSKFENIPILEQKSLSLFVLNCTEHKFLLSLLSLEYFECSPSKLLSDILCDPLTARNYLKKELTHSQNTPVTQRMKIYEYETTTNAKELQLGYGILNKYFSN